MANENPSPASKPRLPSLQTMILNFLGCTTSVSPIEEMCYTTTSKRLTLNSPPPRLDLLQEPPLTRSESISSKTSKKRGFKKKQSIIIGSPSGFQHEFHVNSQSELLELEILRSEVERRVQEAAARHAEMNALSHRGTGLDDGYSSGYTSGYNSRRTSRGPGSAYSSGVKRKPVPSMYPYSPTPASWSNATLAHMPTTARSSQFPESEPGSSALNSTFSPSLLSNGPASTVASSVEDMPSLSCDETESSSIKSSSPPPSTPPTSSPGMTTVPELAASETDSIAPPPIEKDELVESRKDSQTTGISRQPSMFGIDVHFFDFDLFAAEESMTVGAGQAAKDARSELQDLRMASQVVESTETPPLIAV